MNTEAEITLSPEAQEFNNSYVSALDLRVQRSEVVASVATPRDSAVLLFDAQDQKFTLVEKMQDSTESTIFDCIPRAQWGRTVMLFGHATASGGYVASGHGSINGKKLHVKLASGRAYRMEVDAAQAHLQPYVQIKPEKKQSADEPKNSNASRVKQARPPRNREQAEPTPERMDDEGEDFTEEDLMRLRGEIPLAGKSKKKKWRK